MRSNSILAGITFTSDVPTWVFEELENPKAMGEGRNNQMIRLGPTLVRCGATIDDLGHVFHSLYDDLGEEQEREIEAVCRNAIRIAAMESGMSAAEYKRHLAKVSVAESEARQRLKRILRDYCWPVDEIRAHRFGSWGTTRRPLVEQRRQFLIRMFDPSDVVWCGMVWQTGTSTRGFKYTNRFKTVGEWLSLPNISGEFTSHCTFVPGAFSRCKEMVVEQRYMVVESDVLTKDEVGAVFKYLKSELGLSLYAIVSTGGKSLHGWFNWPGDEYAHEWAGTLRGLKCDPSTLRPSQPVRLPGIIRSSTGNPQELIYLA